jgi:tetratricopeptide (TPR) repeat protein
VLVTFPFLVFVLLELLLRAVGYGVSMDFVRRQEVEGEPRYLSNPRFTWLFFDPAVARLCPPFSLAVGKPPDTFRVFVLGSSAAQGDPEPGFGLARMLDVLLRDQYPGVEFEVINAAATAVNSHVVYAMARASLLLEPDLLVLYTGNNEVVGPYGAGTVLTAVAPDLALIRAAVRVRSTRVGQLVGAVARSVTKGIGHAEAPGAWHGMEMFLRHQVRRSDPALQRTYRLYERNLSDTCALARRAGVPVVLSTVAVNLRSCGPFGSLPAPALSPANRVRWQEHYQEGVRLEGEGRWAEAAEALRKATEIDREYAEVNYRLARCEEKLGRYDEALRHYRDARDLDTLRFRADTRSNAIVREVAKREPGVRLAEADRRLDDEAPHGTPGDEDFLDHVHLTFRGNYRVSLVLLERIREVLPEWVRRRGSGRPALGEDACARQLVFTELDRYLIDETMAQRLREPPFTGQVDHAEQMERFTRELTALRTHGESDAVDTAIREYERALAQPHPSWSVRERYATIERRVGKTAEAIREWQVLARQFPQYPSFHLQLARTLREVGRYEEAAASLGSVLEYQPDSAVALVEAARLALARGQPAEARGYARRAAVLDPRDAGALHILARSLCPPEGCTSGERAEAIGLLTRALEVAPESDAVRRDLEALRSR